MILQQEKIEVKRSDDFEEVQYGVNETNVGLLFQMLRSNLYSNIHGSILREYVSNCYDSHVEAGKPDEIIEVKLVAPESTEAGSLTFIDKGVGLSPERIQTIFSKYLSSTKRDDNEQIGGFGLGSKSLFAFTERFIITTIVDSIEYEYLAYIDETGLGKIALTRKEELKDKLPYNQTSIQAVIEQYSDYKSFLRELKGQLEFFRYVRITDNGVDITDKILASKEDFDAIAKADYDRAIAGLSPRSELRLLVGSVCYCVPDNILTECFRKIGVTNSSYINKFPMIKVPIGKVQLTMSREDVNYVESTKTYISEVLKSWISDAQKKYIDWLETSKKYNTVEEFLVEGDFKEVAENLSFIEASPKVLDKFKDYPLLAEFKSFTDFSPLSAYAFLPNSNVITPTINPLDVYAAKKDLFSMVGFFSDLRLNYYNTAAKKLHPSFKFICLKDYIKVGGYTDLSKLETKALYYQICKFAEKEGFGHDTRPYVIIVSSYTHQEVIDKVAEEILKHKKDNKEVPLGKEVALKILKDKTTDITNEIIGTKNLIKEFNLAKALLTNPNAGVKKSRQKIVVPDDGFRVSLYLYSISKSYSTFEFTLGHKVYKSEQDFWSRIKQFLKDSDDLNPDQEIIFIKSEGDLDTDTQEIAFSLCRQRSLYNTPIIVFYSVYKKYEELVDEILNPYVLEDIQSVIPKARTLGKLKPEFLCTLDKQYAATNDEFKLFYAQYRTRPLSLIWANPKAKDSFDKAALLWENLNILRQDIQQGSLLPLLYNNHYNFGPCKLNYTFVDHFDVAVDTLLRSRIIRKISDLKNANFAYAYCLDTRIDSLRKTIKNKTSEHIFDIHSAVSTYEKLEKVKEIAGLDKVTRDFYKELALLQSEHSPLQLVETFIELIYDVDYDNEEALKCIHTSLKDLITLFESNNYLIK